MRDAGCWIIDARCRTQAVGCEPPRGCDAASEILSPASSTQHPTSSIQHPASSISPRPTAMTDQYRDEEPVYVISIASRRVGMHPQTLRLYERLGLVKPARHGSNRLYSDRDIERLRQIQNLTQHMGVNL